MMDLVDIFCVGCLILSVVFYTLYRISLWKTCQCEKEDVIQDDRDALNNIRTNLNTLRSILKDLADRANSHPEQVELNIKAVEAFDKIMKERDISEEKLWRKYGK